MELKKHLDSGLQMSAYYLSGSDDYLKRWSLAVFKNRTANPELNYTELESPSDREVVDALISMPFGGDLRVVYADILPLGSRILTDYLKNPSRSSVLITSEFSEAKAGKKKDDSIKQFFSEVDCSELSADVLLRWIANMAAKYEAAISTPAAKLLIAYARSNLSRISTELVKLAEYRQGQEITEGDVKALVTPDLDYKAWELSQAVANGDHSSALKIADKFEADKMRFEMIFGVLYKLFHNLFYIAISDEDDAINVLGIKGSAYYYQSRDAKKFGAAKLKKILLLLGEIDLAAKTGKLDESVSIRTLIVALTANPQ